MNLYITDNDLYISACNLDNHRLTKQAYCLVRLISNVINNSKLLTEMAHGATPDYTPLQNCILKPDNKLNHTLIDWTNKSYYNFSFVLSFANCVSKALGTTYYPLIMEDSVSFNYRAFISLVNQLDRNFNRLSDSFMPLYIDCFDLYRSTQAKYDNITDTKEAYKKQLINYWKAEFIKSNETKKAILQWKVENKGKLKAEQTAKNYRNVYRPSWGKREHSNIPKFAIAELKQFIEG